VREALAARSDRDFGGGARGRASRSSPGLIRRLLSAALQRPGAVAGALVIAGAASAIVVNALSMQTSRHPAPIVTKAGEGPAVRPRPQEPAAPPSVAPVPPARPPAGVPPTQQAAAPRAAIRDPIGDMIRAADTTTGTATGPRSSEQPAEPQRVVASAQRALSKLGYGPLKPDGLLGQGTRQALERFQRERRLPATGELGPRTIRELSAQAGMTVD
jgi:hypothetical protein